MLKNELLKLVEGIEESGSIDEVLSNTDLVKGLLSSNLNLENFKAKMNEGEFKGYLDSIKDQHSSKALETWKKNNLQKLIDDEIKKRDPNKTPEQIKIEELEKKFADMEKAKTRAEMTSKYKDVLSEKGVDSKYLKFLLADDEETTTANIEEFVGGLQPMIETMTNNKLRNPNPPKVGGNENLTDMQKAEQEISKYFR